MSTPKALGRLQPVELREHWPGEASDFTPWLADDENIALLGEAIGMDLEVQNREERVGPFRADILCIDRSSPSQAKVLIENQIERTDHGHLGQLLTYAAGLEAVSIVWVARSFTEEHRAALDWLNRVTHDSVNFFGLEIELWRIGESPAAPKFNVVVKPNDWAQSVSEAAAQSGGSKWSELYLEFWTGFNALLEQRKGAVRAKPPKPYASMGYGIGRTYFWMQAEVYRRTREAWVALYVNGPDRHAYFNLLQADRAAIEKTLGSGMLWDRKENRSFCYIGRQFAECDVQNRSDWPRQHALLADSLEAFHKAFAARVKKLDAGEWNPALVEPKVATEVGRHEGLAPSHPARFSGLARL